MSVERIKNTIIGEAEEEACKIKKEAEAKRDERLEKSQHKIEGEFKQKLENAREEMDQESERKIIQKRSKHNLELLKKRNEILNSVFEEAYKQLKSLDDAAYQSMLAAWAEQIPEGVAGKIFCNSSDIDRIKPLVMDINKNKDVDIGLDVDDEIDGGIVFRSENFEIDMTVRSKMHESREELAPEVASMLFPEDIKI